MHQPTKERGGSEAIRRRLVDWQSGSVVLVSCLVYSFHQTPVPGVNEPHYLAMARSFVDPGWCARDPFLQSHPVHWAFFTFLGWPTYWWGFETAAVFGRILGYGALSIGWVALIRQLTTSRWGAVGLLFGMLISMSIGNFSGEWLIGGIEGKVFAYGAVFGSLACLIAGDLARGALWTGAAIAFHPVVGMWHLIAAVGTFGVLKMQRSFPADVSIPETPPGRRGFYWGIAIVLGLIGFLPAAQLLVHVPPEIADQGTRIQVYQRLPHHLNPITFPTQAYWCYGGLSASFLGLLRFVPKSRAWRLCGIYVAWCVVFALAGIVVGYFPAWFPESGLDRLSPRLLKFYPFRMADLLLPWFVVLGVWNLLTEVPGKKSPAQQQVGLTVALACVLGILMVRHPGNATSTALPSSQTNDWIEVCDWIRQETPVDALFLTTRRGSAFKWYAERAEYFSFKDAPQDAEGLVAWEQRQRLLWELFADRFSLENLRKFRERTGTDFVLIARETPCDLRPMYENRSFAIYDLRGLRK